MPSLISGFEYDIFISYRHNDNRGGWVTEFVTALKTELAATIKEPVSIYFDSNPHDGLLETHNVDKSLEGKLKCLIFIPIISQTYCDPKSFAWQHEFCAFNKLAKEDQLGRDIKLSNGNVASRILSIKIHDLEAEDQAIIENETGSVLRAIEFIYKEPGVNRPLKLNDNKIDNQNKTDYRNQLNKIANAIKELIYSIIKPSGLKTQVSIVVPTVKEIDTKPSIAVLPFSNLSRDPEQEYFSDGITENIISELASNKSLRIISRTSVMRYKKTTLSAPQIADELNVKFILEGGVQTSGKKVRINLQLVEAAKDDLTWSKIFVENMDDIFEIQSNVASVVAKELNASFVPAPTEPEEKIPTKNQEAYNLFMKGRHAFNQWSVEGYKLATDYFKKAIALDPEFQQAYSYLASSFSARMSWNGDLSPMEALLNIEKYLAEAWKRGPTENDYVTKGFVEFFINKDFPKAEQFLLQAIERNVNDANAQYTYCYLLNMMGRFEEAMQWLNKAKLIEPLSVAYFNYQTVTLHLFGKNEEALNTLQEGLSLYPSVLRFYDFMARIYLTLERWADAEEAILTGFRMSTLRPPSMVAFLAIASAFLNKKDKSKELLDELVKRSENNERGVHINIVYVFSATGDFEAGTHWLNKARQTNDVGLIWWNIDPLYKNLRDHLQIESKPLPPTDFPAAEKQIMALLEAEMPKHPYHNLDHVLDVLRAAVLIAENENVNPDEIKWLRLAALFHDAGFIQSPNNHEERGALMAKEILPAYGLQTEQIEQIGKMILATRVPQSPATHLEKILCDADLDYLGRDDFYAISNNLFLEMQQQGVVESEREWNIMQRTFLQGHRYHTEFGKNNREAKKQERLKEIGIALRKR